LRVAYSYLFFLPRRSRSFSRSRCCSGRVHRGHAGSPLGADGGEGSGISFTGWCRPLLVASLAVVLLDLGLTELAPGASARPRRAAGEKNRPADHFALLAVVYRADSGGCTRSARSSCGRAARRCGIRSWSAGNGGGLPDDPGRGAARDVRTRADRAPLDARQKGRFATWSAPGGRRHSSSTPSGHHAARDTHGAAGRAKAPDEMRYAEAGALRGPALARSGSDTRKLPWSRRSSCRAFALHHHRAVGAPLAFHAPERHRVGRGGVPGDHLRRPPHVPAVEGRGQGGALPPTFAAWMPNVLFGAAGVWLWRKART